MHLENSIVMYSIYNVETLQKVINTVHHIHTITTPYKKLYEGKQDTGLLHPVYINIQGIQLYSKNSLLYLRIVKEKCFSVQRINNTIAHIHKHY